MSGTIQFGRYRKHSPISMGYVCKGGNRNGETSTGQCGGTDHAGELTMRCERDTAVCCGRVIFADTGRGSG